MYEELGCEVHLDLPVVIGTVGLQDNEAEIEVVNERRLHGKSKSNRKEKRNQNNGKHRAKGNANDNMSDVISSETSVMDNNNISEAPTSRPSVTEDVERKKKQ